jgi:hypothetical protein
MVKAAGHTKPYQARLAWLASAILGKPQEQLQLHTPATDTVQREQLA